MRVCVCVRERERVECVRACLTSPSLSLSLGERAETPSSLGRAAKSGDERGRAREGRAGGRDGDGSDGQIAFDG